MVQNTIILKARELTEQERLSLPATARAYIRKHGPQVWAIDDERLPQMYFTGHKYDDGLVVEKSDIFTPNLDRIGIRLDLRFEAAIRQDDDSAHLLVLLYAEQRADYLRAHPEIDPT